MSKKRSRSNSTSKASRVLSKNANRRLHKPHRYMSRQLDLFTDYPLSMVEDNRTFDFDPYPKTTNGNRARYKANVRNFPTSVTSLPGNISPIAVSFQQPKNVIACVRRKIREEVLHAFNKTGKRGQRRPRRTPTSPVKC